jgi:hypothetical protein
MKIFISLLFFLVCFDLVVFSQEPLVECATPEIDVDTSSIPWYGNNEILNEYLEEYAYLLIGNNRIEGRSSDVCIDDIQDGLAIPIKFWIWLAPGELPSVYTVDDIRGLLDGGLSSINGHFKSNGMKIRFYALCPTYVNTTEVQLVYIPDLMLDAGDIYTFAHAAYISQHPEGAVAAIHINVVGDAPFGGMYNPGTNQICLTRTSNATTATHEIGHYFGLNHTHQFTAMNPRCCSAEPVTRGKANALACLFYCFNTPFQVNNVRCSRTGDFLCDTPADDRAVHILDQYGVPYAPAITNIIDLMRR